MTVEPLKRRPTVTEIERSRKRLAIAGASGQFGRMLLSLGHGYEFTALQHRTDIPEPCPVRGIIEGFDVTKREIVLQTVGELARNGVTTLVNSTGIINIDASEPERGRQDGPAYQVNTVGAENLAIACKEFGIRLIQISTQHVFNGRRPFGEKYRETDLPDTDITGAPTWYGLTKALAEQRILEIYPEGSVIIRLSHVQGPKGGLFPLILKALVKDSQFTAANDQLMSPIMDATAVDAVTLIEKTMHMGEPGQIYHVSSIDAYTPYQICMMLADALGLSEKARRLITPVTITIEQLVMTGRQTVVKPKNAILDVSRFQIDFGVGILHSVEEEISRFKSLYGNLVV